MSQSDPVPGLRSFARFLTSIVLVLALAALGLWLVAKPAAAAGFHSCDSQKLDNKGIVNLKASHAKCRLARQVAFSLRGGDRTPKGFSCVAGQGGNLTPFRCSRRDQLVRFSLEG